ncbi:MAG TPA: sugar transferase [Ktedonobacterales bacterium]|nr:sugar transferase [Ktedonobacterales bacterium]
MKKPYSQAARPVTLPIAEQPTQPTRVPTIERPPHRRSYALRILLLLWDALMINLAFLVAYYVRYQLQQNYNLTDQNRFFAYTPYEDYLFLQAGITIGLLVLLWLRGAYRLRFTTSWVRHLSIIFGATTIGLAVLTIYEYFFTQSPNLLLLSTNGASRGLIIYTWIGATALLVAGRLVLRAGLGFAYRHGLRRAHLLVIGCDRLGKMMMQHLAANPQLGYQVIGFIDAQTPPATHFGRFKSLGAISDLEEIIRRHRVDQVLIALPSHQHQQIVRTVRLCERAGAEFKLIPDLYELSLSMIDMDTLEGIPLIGIKQPTISPWHYLVKRGIDLTLAGLALLLGSPIWLLAALVIKLDSRGPVLFKQQRVGYRGRLFQVYKFRSMRQHADQEQAALRQMNEASGPIFKIKEDPRRTRVGKFLRSTSIDELPQLLNVLKGEMSLVGPRPPLPSEVEQYEAWERGRLEVLPGITGLWQVRGRSELDFDEMVLMDLYYIENWSLRLDLHILLKTIPAVLFSRGAY